MTTTIQRCERNCSREGMTKEEYTERMKNPDTAMGQVHCCGCHEPVLVDLKTSIQYYDVDNVLKKYRTVKSIKI